MNRFSSIIHDIIPYLIGIVSFVSGFIVASIMKTTLNDIKAWMKSIFKISCDNWPCRFLGRFLFLLIVGAALFAFLGVAICKFDSLDIVRRATSYFAQYHSSVPVILVLLAIALICCIPGGPTALLNLSKRLKKAGPFEFFQADDPDVPIALLDVDSENPKDNKLSKLKRAMLKMKYKKEINGLSTKGLDSALIIIDDLFERKENIIDFHAGQIGAVAVKRKVKLKDADLFFDAYLERASDCIAVRILPADSQCVSEVAKNVKELLERIPTAKMNTFFVHLVFYKTPGGVENLDGLNHVRWILFNFTNVRLFFYDLVGNNAVAPSKKIP